MKIVKKSTKFSIEHFLIYAFIISSVFCGTVEWKFLVSSPMPSFLANFLVVFVGLLAIAYELILVRLPVRWFYFILYFLAVIGLHLLATRDNVLTTLKSYLTYLLVFFTYAVLLIKRGKIKVLFSAYANVFTVIGFITVFFWLFGSVLNILPGRSTNEYKWADKICRGYTYFRLYFENFFQNQKLLGVNLPRNCGIYTEAPAFSGMLLHAFGIELFAEEGKNKKKVIILFIALLSTQSTKALIILIITMIVRMMVYDDKKHNVFWRLKWFLLIVLIPIAGVVIRYILVDKSSTYSFTARMAHLRASIVTWLQHPLFGVGISNSQAIIANSTMPEAGLSMGLAVLLAKGGLLLFVFYFLAFWLPFKNKNLRNIRKEFCLFSMMAFMNLFVSNSAFGVAYILMLSVAYASCAVNYPKKREN